MNLQMEINSLKQRIAELEQQAKQEQEFPQEGYEFWFITSSGDVARMFWHDDLGQEQSLSIGNVFKTSEEAEFAVEKLKVEAELRKFGRPFTWREKNWFLTMDSDKDILIEYDDYGAYQGTIYFESKDKAKEAIQPVGVERIKKYIFGVED